MARATLPAMLHRTDLNTGLPRALRRRVHGFSLLEQTAMVAALGVLSAAALPRLAELRGGAEQAALVTVAAAAGTAMLMNRGACAVAAGAPGGGQSNACIAVRNCSQAHDLLATPLPASYRVPARALPPGPGPGQPGEADCEVVHVDSGARAVFRGIAAGG